MMAESKRLMKNIVHENNWYFYHDVLSLMTADQSVKWMEETEIDGVKIKKRWLTPQLELNQGTVYFGRPVGNSPEFMPLDNSLNADIMRSFEYHCSSTSILPKLDPRRFGMETPKKVSECIHRLFDCEPGEDGVPDSGRIIHDCDQVWDSMESVYEEEGAVVHSICDRNGHRYRKADAGTHGGGRIKGEWSELDWMDPLAKIAIFEHQHGIIRDFSGDVISDNDSDDDSISSSDSNSSSDS